MDLNILEYWPYVIVGFLAQIVDGALGMAFGVTASTLLLYLGMPLAVTSATVHAAEVFTTGASGLSHHAFGNVDRNLFGRLLLPGILGAILGAYILVSLSGEVLKPLVAVYLMAIGGIVIYKAFRDFPSQVVTTHLSSLGFVGALLDALGGGGWGPIVASTLMARGNSARMTIGSVNAVEFFVTAAASVTFLLTIGISHWPIILALSLGGLIAAPVAAYLCARLPKRACMVTVGLLVIFLSARTLIRS